MIEYNNLYVHFVLTTLHREPIIAPKHRERIEKYISGIIANNGCLQYAIYANMDHVHILLSKSPDISENELLQKIQVSSQKFINDNKLCKVLFGWQESASAFSVSKSDIDKVCKYILNQREHHRRKTFQEEYDEFIKHYETGVNKVNKV